MAKYRQTGGQAGHGGSPAVALPLEHGPETTVHPRVDNGERSAGTSMAGAAGAAGAYKGQARVRAVDKRECKMKPIMQCVR